MEYLPRERLRTSGSRFASYYNYRFELLGDLTGGLRFDAMSHFVINDTPGLVLLSSPEGIQ